MEDRDKTKERLISELRKMRQSISAFEASETRFTQVEEELRKGKEFLEKVIDTARDGIVITDEKGHITMLNDAMERMLGYSRDELLGKHSSSLVPPDEELLTRIGGELNNLFKDGELFGCEAIWQRKDGQYISTEFNMTLLRDKDGQIIGGVSFARDVTEKKKVENMLLQSEKLKSLGELAGGVA